MDRPTKIGVFFLCLFSLPFAGFGLFALATGIHGIINGDVQSQMWLIPFGLVFCGIGFGLMYAVVKGSRLAKFQERKQAEHPSEPWLWRDDWAQGRVPSKTRSNMIGAWVFAVLWNLVSMPILFILPLQAAKKPIAYIGLIFPLAGVFLLVRAVRQSLAYREFGKTYFEMASVPGVIGGELKGAIQTRLPRAPEHGIHLRLTCVNRVTTGSGDDRNTQENIVWRAESDVSSAQVYPGPAASMIPVSFRIPWNAQPSGKRGPGDEIVWQVEAIAAVPGVDYHDIFEVPVFRTKDTPSQPEPEAAVVAPLAVQPPTLTVQVTRTAQGVEFYFPAARNKGFATGTTVFLLIFGSIAYFLTGSRAPFIFPLAFGFFALILLYVSAQMWIGTTRVGVGSDVLLVQDGLLGGGKLRRFAFTELASIDSKITSQQGGSTGTCYYDIVLALNSGKKVTLGRTLPNKQEVDWLTDELRRLTGLQAKAMAAVT